MYNQRKDTKKYQDLVRNYCRSRCSVESFTEESKRQKKEIEQYQAELDKGIYNDVVNAALRIAVTMTKLADWGQFVPHHQEDMERYGNQLVNEYGDNLDDVYTTHKNDW